MRGKRKENRILRSTILERPVNSNDLRSCRYWYATDLKCGVAGRGRKERLETEVKLEIRDGP